MRLRKRFCLCALVVALLCSMLCISASAEEIGVEWRSPFARFTEVYQGSTSSGYIKAAQRFLYCFPSTHRLIADHGKMDGRFGPKTKEAAIKYQKYEWNNTSDSNMWDGRIGAKTWSKIAYRLNPEVTETDYSYYLNYGNEHVYYLDTRAEGCTYYSYYVTDDNQVFKEDNWFAQK